MRRLPGRSDDEAPRARGAEGGEGELGVEGGLHQAHRVRDEAPGDRQGQAGEIGVAGQQGPGAGHVGAGRVAPPALHGAGYHRGNLPRVADQDDAPGQAGDLLEAVVRQLVGLVHQLQVERRAAVPPARRAGVPVPVPVSVVAAGAGAPRPAAAQPGPAGGVGDDDAGAGGQDGRVAGDAEVGQKGEVVGDGQVRGDEEGEGEAGEPSGQAPGEVEGLLVGLRHHHAALPQQGQALHRQALHHPRLPRPRGRVQEQGGEALPLGAQHAAHDVIGLRPRRRVDFHPGAGKHGDRGRNPERCL